MRKIIFISVIQQLLYHISRVESLIGQNFTPIRGDEFPFIASFQFFPEGHNFCSGALITKKHVITAAYCLEGIHLQSFHILFEVAHAQEPDVSYNAASWTTYVDWAREQGRSSENSVAFNVAIVTLIDRVYHVNPVPISGLTKMQLDGKAATMIGWKNEVLSKTTVQLLSDQDCQRKVSVIVSDVTVSDVRMLCAAANNSIALLEIGDIGSPLIHAHDNSLVGIAFAASPDQQHVTGNFPTEFIQQHQINGYYSIKYYRSFIYSIIPAVPAA